MRWDQFLSFPALSELQLNKIKGKFNFIKWMTVRCQLLCRETLLGATG